MTDSQMAIDFTRNDTRSRHDGPVTSAMAAAAALPRSGTQKARIVELLARHPRGLTSLQIQEYLRLPGDSVRPRLVSLREDGWAHETDETRPTPSGNTAAVWSITSQTRRRLADGPA